MCLNILHKRAFPPAIPYVQLSKDMPYPKPGTLMMKITSVLG
ncbi:hypothetical protein C2W64_01905 [Brevibacillus laterosporus]|nr:hypothetical protein C2W64_01905 [Brevibacillus laterosporus]